MKSQIKFTVLFICVLIALPLLGQTEKKQSLSFSFYPATMHTLMKDQSPYMHNNDDWGERAFEAIMGNYGFKAVGYDTYHYGAWELAYKRFLSRWFQLNLGLSCELSSKHWDLYDRPDGFREKRILDYRINLMPGINCFTLNKDFTKLYVSNQIGVQWIHRGMEYLDGGERNQWKFAWQFWYVIDQKISDSFRFNLGLGYGVFGIVKMGVSYHF